MGRVSDAKQRLMRAVLELIWTGSYGSTTIDQICDRAEVQKGSFYHFFDSKAELATAAIEMDWENRRPQLDALFSPTVPPLERLRKFAEFAYEKQAQVRKGCGCVLGCPLFALGAEVCTREAKLKHKIQEVLAHYREYLESAIRDARAANLVRADDPAAKARMIFAYYEGLLTQARIQNDVEVLREMPRGVFTILGIEQAPVAA
jgi:TetR/AcrR family transcriptional regulator, transcriptional repressor for nem operon